MQRILTGQYGLNETLEPQHKLARVNLTHLRNIAEYAQSYCPEDSCITENQQFSYLVENVFGDNSMSIVGTELEGCTGDDSCLDKYLASDFGKEQSNADSEGSIVAETYLKRSGFYSIIGMKEDNAKKQASGIAQRWDALHQTQVNTKLSNTPQALAYLQLPSTLLTYDENEFLFDYNALVEASLYDIRGEQYETISSTQNHLEDMAQQLTDFSANASILSKPLLVINKTADTLMLDEVALKTINNKLIEAVILLVMAIIMLLSIFFFISSAKPKTNRSEQVR